jgi:uncharacterized phiE125 gp8 family phage protein
MLIEESTVADAVLPLDAFKAHLRLGTGFADDTVQDVLALSFLRAALAAVEARTGKALLSRSFGWTVSAWRDRAAAVLPIAPVVRVDRVAQVTREGVETEVDAQGYWLERDLQRPRLRAVGPRLPDVPRDGTVKVSLTAGYGPDWASLPGDLAQAVLMLAAHYHEHRDNTGLGQGCMPFGVSSLLDRHRGLRLGFAP